MKNTKLVLRTIETPEENNKPARINQSEQRKPAKSNRPSKQKSSRSRSRQSEKPRDQNPSTPDNMSIKHVHTMTKDLLNTLTTVEKSLDMVTKIAGVMNQYDINPSKLNIGNAYQFLKTIDPAQLENLLRLIPQQSNKSE